MDRYQHSTWIYLNSKHSAAGRDLGWEFTEALISILIKNNIQPLSTFTFGNYTEPRYINFNDFKHGKKNTPKIVNLRMI